MGLVRIALPGDGTPVSLADVKAFLGIEDAAFDGRLSPLLAGAVRQVEAFTGKSLSDQAWALTLPGFVDAVELPRGPVVAVTGVTYIDPAGAEQTLDPAAYALDIVSDPQVLRLAHGASWPATLAGEANAVRIAFTAGFEDGIEDIRLALLAQVKAAFEAGAVALTDGVMAALRRYRRVML